MSNIQYQISNAKVSTQKPRLEIGYWKLDIGNLSRGFTLIELLVVMTIIGLLASLGLSTYSQYQKRARDAQRKFDISSVQSALEQYYSQTNPQRYPSGSWSDMFTALGPNGEKLLKFNPTDPSTNTTTPYYYVGDQCGTNNICQMYYICARLENSADSDILSGRKNCTPPSSPSGGYNYGVSSP